jgi:hypothetical protein
VWGNKRLAFVNTAVLYESPKSLGQLTKLIVLTRPDAYWEVKLVGQDVRIVSELASAIPKLGSDTTARMQVPALLHPSDQASVPRLPDGPQLQWTNVSATAYLIESQFEGGPQWSENTLDLALPRSGERIIKRTATFGVGKQPHRWRIWAIDEAGHVLLSEWRVINFTN